MPLTRWLTLFLKTPNNKMLTGTLIPTPDFWDVPVHVMRRSPNNKKNIYIFYLFFMDHLYLFFLFTVTRTNLLLSNVATWDQFRETGFFRFFLVFFCGDLRYSQLSECVALCCWFPLFEFASHKIDPLPMPSVPCRSTFYYLSFFYVVCTINYFLL